MPKKRKLQKQDDGQRKKGKKNETENIVIQSPEKKQLFDEEVLRQCKNWDKAKYDLLNDSDHGSKKHNAFFRTISNGLENLRIGSSAAASGLLALSTSKTETVTNMILTIINYAALVHGVSISAPVEITKGIIKYALDRRRKNKAQKISNLFNDHNKDFRIERIKVAYNLVIRYWEPLEKLREDSAEIVANLALKRMGCYLEEFGSIASQLIDKDIELHQQLPIAVNIMHGVTPHMINFEITPEYKKNEKMYVASFFDKGGIKVISPTEVSLYLSQDPEIKRSSSRYQFRIGTHKEAEFFNMVKLTHPPEWYSIGKIVAKDDESSKEVHEIKKQVDVLFKICRSFGNSKVLEPAIASEINKLLGQEPKPVSTDSLFRLYDEKGTVREFKEIKAALDGNCLFESLYNGLKITRSLHLNGLKVNGFSDLRKLIAEKLESLQNKQVEAEQTLKQMVIDTIGDIIRGVIQPVGFPEDLKSWLVDCQREYKSCQKEALNEFIEKNAFPAYIKAISKDKTWGHVVEMHVVSHIFKIKVMVYEESKDTPTTIINKQYSDKIDLYYRDNRTHYHFLEPIIHKEVQKIEASQRMSPKNVKAAHLPNIFNESKKGVKHQSSDDFHVHYHNNFSMSDGGGM